MEQVITQIASMIPAGSLPIVVCILGLAYIYFKIQTERKVTGKKRDEDTESINTRITLLEADNKLLHTQLDTIGNKLDRIIDQLCEIKVELAKKEDKE